MPLFLFARNHVHARYWVSELYLHGQEGMKEKDAL